MSKFIKYVLETLLIGLVLVVFTFVGIVKYPANVFHDSYQSMIQDKYQSLVTIKEPKIIMVAGSSSSFGLDQKMLEKASGYKVVNLGLHAGFGNLFFSELSKANINKGDIVLLGYEYTWHEETGFDQIGTELVMTGIDDNIKLYKYIPPRKWSSLLGYLFTYAAKKNVYHETPASGVYSREAFDPDSLEITNIPVGPYDAANGGMETNVTEPVISDCSKEYLKDYKDLIESKGANVYFVAPPLCRDCLKSDPVYLDELKKLEESEIGIDFISNPQDYLFPTVLMSNAQYHCNPRGVKLRTMQLICDLNKADVISIYDIHSYTPDEGYKLAFINDIDTYLKSLKKENYTILMSVKEDASSGIMDNTKKCLIDLGLKAKFIDKYGYGYCAVINSNGVDEECSHDCINMNGTLGKDKLNYAMTSAGYDAGAVSSVVIEGNEYSMNSHGLNIVVYDDDAGEVIDSVCFDTSGNSLAFR